MGFPIGSAGKESSCNAGDLGSIPGLGRSPGEENGYPFQYSGLENSMDSIVYVYSLSLPHIEGPPWPRDIEGGTCVRGPKPRPAIPVFPGEFSMCCAWASIPDLVHTDHVLTPRGLSSAFAEVPSLSSTSSKIRSYLRVFICVFIISGPIPLTVRIIDQHDLTIHLTDKK